MTYSKAQMIEALGKIRKSLNQNEINLKLKI